MRVLLVNPYRNERPSPRLRPYLRNTQLWDGGEENYDFGTYPLEVPYLGAILREAGHEVSFLDAHRLRLTPERIEFGPYHWVLVSTAPYGKWRCPPFSYRHALHVAERAHEAGAKVAVYGPHCTLAPSSFLEAADRVILGEPEGGILQALSGEEQVVSAALPALDALPHPAFDLIDFPLYDARYLFQGQVKGRLGVLAGSRGCPYSCTFCLKPLAPTLVRRHSVAQALAMARELVERHHCVALDWEDLTFTLYKRWTLALCEGLSSLKVPYSIATRSDRLDREMVQALARSGCYVVNLGVESASAEVLRLMRKGYTWEQSLEAVRLCRQASIPIVNAYQILFAPGDTPDSVAETVARVGGKLKLAVTFAICTPYPGTQLWEMGVREGKLPAQIDSWDHAVEAIALRAGTIGNTFRREEVIAWNRRIARGGEHILSLTWRFYRSFGFWALLRRLREWWNKEVADRLMPWQEGGR